MVAQDKKRGGGQDKKTLKADLKASKESGVFLGPASKGGKQSLPKDAGSFLKHRKSQKLKDLKKCGREGLLAHDMLSLQTESVKRAEEYHRQVEEEAAATPEDVWGFENQAREVDNGRRRFYRELRRVLAAADVVVMVLDARDPDGCRSEEIEKEVGAAGKKLILLLNKIDLVPKHALEAWLAYLKRSFPTIPFKAARSGTQRANHANVNALNATEGMLSSTNLVLGADTLIQLLKNYSRSGDMKAHITVGIVGYPNVGKSSVINSLKRHQAVNVGGTAGVTKQMQEVKLDSKVTLLDCPGVVFSGESDDPSVALRNAVKLENLPDPIATVEALIERTPRESLLEYYEVPDFTETKQFLISIAQARGKLQRGAGLDLTGAALSILQDWMSGKFRYYVLPPVDKNAEAIFQDKAKVVTTLAPEMDLDALLAGKGEEPVVEDLNDDDDMDTDQVPMVGTDN